MQSSIQRNAETSRTRQIQTEKEKENKKIAGMIERQNVKSKGEKMEEPKAKVTFQEGGASSSNTNMRAEDTQMAGEDQKVQREQEDQEMEENPENQQKKRLFF